MPLAERQVGDRRSLFHKLTQANVGAKTREAQREVSERPAGGKQAKAKDQRVPAEEADEVEIVDIEGKDDEIEIIDVEDPPPKTPEPIERASSTATAMETRAEASSKQCATPDANSKPAAIEAPRVAQFSREDVANAAEAVRKEPQTSSKFMQDSCKYPAPAFLPRDMAPAMPGYRWHEPAVLPSLPSWDPWMLSDAAAHAAGVPASCDRKRRDRKKKSKKPKKARGSTPEAPTRAEITARFDALAQDLDFGSESGSQSDGKLSESGAQGPAVGCGLSGALAVLQGNFAVDLTPRCCGAGMRSCTRLESTVGRGICVEG
eukprot:s4362_g3.t3